MSPGDDNDMVTMSPGDDNDMVTMSPGDDNDMVTMSPGDDNGSCQTIPELLCDGEVPGSFTIFCQLWTAGNVNADGDSITVFAPVDEAFISLYALLGQYDVELDDETIAEVFLFHATPGMVMSTNLECGGLVEMIAGGSSRTKCGRFEQVDYLIQKGGGNRKNNIEPVIIDADIMACGDSVVHVVSEVLLPNFIDELM